MPVLLCLLLELLRLLEPLRHKRLAGLGGALALVALLGAKVASKGLVVVAEPERPGNPVLQRIATELRS